MLQGLMALDEKVLVSVPSLGSRKILPTFGADLYMDESVVNRLAVWNNPGAEGGCMAWRKIFQVLTETLQKRPELAPGVVNSAVPVAALESQLLAQTC